jgi:hypothetical protein
MSPFWEGFFSIFGGGFCRSKTFDKYRDLKPYQWYEPVDNWQKHSLWNNTWTKKKDRN